MILLPTTFDDPFLSPPLLTPLYPLPPSPPPQSPDIARAHHRLRRFLSIDDPRYIPPVPNLELHSAAASGNVGLVHYALTHGQPVNSVLHGVLPLHAACSGGSATVVRMLLERGADVNAPRLPRRYSDGKKSNVPSVGTTGSTPLHFAAANGHAAIVQILLTCGAIPDKPDKNGMTPEALAETNGHTEVIRVMRVWEHLKRQESQSSQSTPSLALPDSIAGPSSEAADVRSIAPEPSENGDARSEIAFPSAPSIKGKERDSSVLSAGPAAERERKISGVKKSLGGLFKRNKRPSVGSAGSSPTKPGGSKPALVISAPLEAGPRPESPHPEPPDDAVPAELPAEPQIIDLGDDGEESDAHVDWHDAEEMSDALGFSLPAALASDPSLYSDTVESIQETSTNELASPATPRSHPPSPLGQVVQPEPDANPENLHRVMSGASAASGTSHHSGEFGVRPQRRHRTSSASHRPSLPSILERATHPAAAFRAAMRRDPHGKGHSPESAFSPISDESMSPTSPTFFRGRARSNDKHAAAKKYLNKHALVSIFRRSNSPPSRSPSPPKRTNSSTSRMVEDGELDEGIEKLRRASLDLDIRESGGNPDESTSTVSPDPLPPMPASAPAIKTRFFEDLNSNPLTPLDLSMLQYDRDQMRTPTPTSPTSPTSPGGSRPRSKARTGSEVLVPSPLANEWQRGATSDSEDSSSPGPGRMRRSRTEVFNYASSRAGNYGSLPSRAGPGGFNKRHAKKRSATLPSVPLSTYLPWEEAASLRKAAVTGRRSLRMSSAGGSPEQGPAQDQPLSAETAPGALKALDNELADPISDIVLPDAIVVTSESTDEEDSAAGPSSSADTAMLGPNMVSSRPESGDGDATPMAQPEVPVETDDDTTPEATPSIDGPQVIDFSLPSPSRSTGRYRGASIGSMNTDSSRLSTPPPSLRMTSIATTNDSSIGSPDSEQKFVYPIPRQAYKTDDGRPRGKSVSSISSSASGMGYSYNATVSTPGSSVTPPSTLSLHLGSGFPPVPEDEVALHRRPTAEETQKLVKQQEANIFQLAQLPDSRDSSLSLAAQLAAYGDNFSEMDPQEHEEDREEVIASPELPAATSTRSREGKTRRKTRPAAGSDVRSISSSSTSFVSAESNPSAPPSVISSVRSRSSSKSKPSSSLALHVAAVTRAGQKTQAENPALPPLPPMISVDAPQTSVPSINSIYDKRAAAYKERMAALTALPPTSASSVRSGASARARARSAAATAGAGPQEMWLTAGPSQHRRKTDGALPEMDRHPHISSPIPITSPTMASSISPSLSASHHPHHKKRSVHSPTLSSLRHPSLASVASGLPLTSSFPKVSALSLSSVGAGAGGRLASSAGSIRSSQAPAPIADVMSTRFQGLQGMGIQGVPPPPMSVSPHVSVFSSRYSGAPHDGDESDDSDAEPQTYTVIENDWRGGHVVNPDAWKKERKWGVGGLKAMGRKK